MINEADIPIELHAGLTMALCVFMFSAVVSDVRENRIKNSVVVMVLLAGLIAQLAMDTSTGFLTWGAGLLIGAGIFLPFYVGGGMGAGDVKLMAAVAAFLGPIGAVIACGTTLFAGLPLAIFCMAKRYISNKGNNVPVNDTSVTQKTHNIGDRIPYAAAIFAGTAVGLWWTGRFEPLTKGLLS